MTMPYQLTPAQMAQMHDDGQSYRQIAESDGRSADSVRGMVSRYRRGLADNAKSYHYSGREAPLTLPDDEYMIVGDIHIPTMDYGFSGLVLEVARRYMKRGDRSLIIAGDFINADAFSTYDSDMPAQPLRNEIEAARLFVAEFAQVFKRIYWIWGNHERRVGKRTKGAITPQHLKDMITTFPIQVSQWGHLVIRNEKGYDWRVTHPASYGINQLKVASVLAVKFQQNIISHHEHHLAMGWCPYGRYALVNNGGLFDYDQLDYAVIDDTTRPVMKNGFTFLKNGCARVYGREPFTDWDEVLGK